MPTPQGARARQITLVLKLVVLLAIGVLIYRSVLHNGALVALNHSVSEATYDPTQVTNSLFTATLDSSPIVGEQLCFRFEVFCEVDLAASANGQARLEYAVAMGQKARRIEDYPLMLAWFSRAATIEPELADANFFVAYAHEQLGDLALARVHYVEAAESPTFVSIGKSEVLWRLVEIDDAMNSAETSASVPLLEEALALNDYRFWPNWQLQTLVSYGLALLRADNFDQSEDIFLQALELDPENYEALVRLGQIEVTRNDVSSLAESYFQQAINANAERPLAYINLARLLSRSERVQESINIYDALLAVDPNHPTALDEVSQLRQTTSP